ncbi:MAG TPA: histidinol-phosphate transaminase [Pyrinomonadaceae bacterium]|nr:histidinol-phosphate transaminase [Pyrinomonadaceae bacterium]
MRDDLKSVFKSEVTALRAYSLEPHETSIKINQNENPWETPKQIKDETLRQFENYKWSRYPPFISSDLEGRLAQFAGWTPDGVLAGNGSNELIQALLMVTMSAGKSVLISEPTFTLYRQIATILGGEVQSVRMTTDFRFDTEAIVNRIKRDDPQVVIVCSPNNPTGTRIPDSDLRRILDAASGLVVVDEAYHEFSEQTVVPLLRDFDNLVVLRTFSKAMALAALRVGYLLSAPDCVVEIRKALLPYNLNLFSQTAARVALDSYATELRPLVNNILSERQRVFNEIDQLNCFYPIVSTANFMIVRSELDPRVVFEHLLSRDILIRDVSRYPMLEKYFRISVGTPMENDLLLQGLRELAS